MGEGIQIFPERFDRSDEGENGKGLRIGGLKEEKGEDGKGACETRRSSMEQTRLQAPRGTCRWRPPLQWGEEGRVRLLG